MIKHFGPAAILCLALASCGADSDAGTPASFEANLKSCSYDRFNASVPGLGSADYIIEGEMDGACNVMLMFSDNINPAWIDQPLRMKIKGERTMSNVMNMVSACLEGRQPMSGDGTCSGSLLEVAGVEPGGSGGLLFGEGPFANAQCGKPYEGETPALYPMIEETSGTWGYLNPAGEWAIEPQFRQAMQFSEGLAAVIKDGRWMVIAPDGSVAIDNIGDIRMRSYSNSGSKKIYTSPIRGFSEGCARYVNDDGKFYLSRDGKLWLNEPTEQMQAAADAVGGTVVDIYDFHNGLARFRIDVEEFKSMDPEGYIDGTGAVAIPAQYARVGDFDADTGLAPVGLPRDTPSSFPKGWIQINAKGEKVLPKDDSIAKEFGTFAEGFTISRGSFDRTYLDVNGEQGAFGKYADAEPFSEGIAFVRPKRGDYEWINTKAETLFKASDVPLCEESWPRLRPFKNGLAQVIVSMDGEPCGRGNAVNFGGGGESFPNGEYAYIDTSGAIKWRASDFAR